MAKIVQSLTRASPEYEESTFQSLVRDLDGVITKLNSSFQEEEEKDALKKKVDRIQIFIFTSIYQCSITLAVSEVYYTRFFTQNLFHSIKIANFCITQ